MYVELLKITQMKKKDIDLFLFGNELDKLNCIRNIVKELNKKYTIGVAIKGAVIDIFIQNIPRKIQFICTNKKSGDDITWRFDATHLMMYYDGKDLFMERMCKKALSEQTTYVLNYDQNNFLQRLYKTINRGYYINLNYKTIIPHGIVFQLDKMNYDNLIDFVQEINNHEKCHQVKTYWIEKCNEELQEINIKIEYSGNKDIECEKHLDKYEHKTKIIQFNNFDKLNKYLFNDRTIDLAWANNSMRYNTGHYLIHGCDPVSDKKIIYNQYYSTKNDFIKWFDLILDKNYKDLLIKNENRIFIDMNIDKEICCIFNNDIFIFKYCECVKTKETTNNDFFEIPLNDEEIEILEDIGNKFQVLMFNKKDDIFILDFIADKNFIQDSYCETIFLDFRYERMDKCFSYYWKLIGYQDKNFKYHYKI